MKMFFKKILALLVVTGLFSLSISAIAVSETGKAELETVRKHISDV